MNRLPEKISFKKYIVTRLFPGWIFMALFMVFFLVLGFVVYDVGEGIYLLEWAVGFCLVIFAVTYLMYRRYLKGGQ